MNVTPLNKKYLAMMIAIIVLTFPQPYNQMRNNILDFVSNSQSAIKVFALFTNKSKNETEVLVAKIESRKTLSISEKFEVWQYNDILNKITFNNAMPGILSLGLDPMVASYNGFRSYDGYVFNYELSYKSKFRPIIQNILQKDPELEDYFDNWGNRVYTFIQPDEISSLDLCYAKSIGVDFILFPRGMISDKRIQLLTVSENLAVGRIECER
jgi:hypothetical protein